MDNIFDWDEFLLPYMQVVDELMVKFKSIDKEYKSAGRHSPIEQVEGRVKRIGSILEKANRKKIPYYEIENRIEDIAGIRIICRFAEDIDTIVNLLRKRDGFDMVIKEERDYVTNAKPSGYRSYHVLIKYSIMSLSKPKEVWAEIQIRTLAMNFWATIEHSLKYKYNGNIPEDVQMRLKNSAKAANALDKEMSTIRDEITEAQKIILVKNDLVDSIVKKIQRLYYVAKIEKVNELNREFIDIYEDCDIDKLTEFNNRLKTIAQIYKVEYI